MSSENGIPVGASTTKKRQRETTSSEVPTRKSRKLSVDTSPTSDEEGRESDAVKPPPKHTKKERKQNRSTRIHSLRKQLARGTLPSTIQQEKERELTALIHEQTKTASKQQAKKTLEKYHYVRFLERRKAEKKLKQLHKKQQAHGDDEDLRERIHEMEVNRNYAVYAPLGEKYVSIFVVGAGEHAGDSNSPLGRPTTKPPTWYAVEDAMRHGEAKLLALRDATSTSLARAGSDSEETTQQQKRASIKSTAKGSSSRKEKSRNKNGSQRRESSDVDKEAESPSDDDRDDGGFFER